MRPKENYRPFIAVALTLTLAIMISFQFYVFREPERIAADEAQDKSAAVEAGRPLFGTYCITCHGKDGEGGSGPALDDKTFLTGTGDQTIFSLISSGVPGTKMPAWNQSLGGPLTDQQVTQIVAFVRSWESTAPDRQSATQQSDPVRGLLIYDSTCTVCHGPNGQGTDQGVALDDPARLAQFDDAWYADTIASGRAAKGMPTWGTVLSPQQIRDLVALLRAWQRGETVNLPGPGAYIQSAAQALAQGDLENAQRHLVEATTLASGQELDTLIQALDALKKGDSAEAAKLLEPLGAAAGDAKK